MNTKIAPEQKPAVKIPPVYLPPHGGPLYWMYETSGILSQAMDAYLNHYVEKQSPPCPEQIEIIRTYFEYWVNAPCWIDSSGTIDELRRQIKTARTLEDLEIWLDKAAEVGLDPL